MCAGASDGFSIGMDACFRTRIHRFGIEFEFVVGSVCHPFGQRVPHRLANHLPDNFGTETARTKKSHLLGLFGHPDRGLAEAAGPDRLCPLPFRAAQGFGGLGIERHAVALEFLPDALKAKPWGPNVDPGLDEPGVIQQALGLQFIEQAINSGLCGGRVIWRFLRLGGGVLA